MVPRALVGALVIAVLAVLGACGQDDPESAVTQAELAAALKDSPPPLKRLYAHGGQLLDGGTDAFKRQLEDLRGYPVVVNKWAAWCGPCRFEFPFFQRLVRREGTRVAFLAVDSRDEKDAARKFLRKFPVPYPSYYDPKGEVARSFRGDRVSPETAFYDSKGELVYTKPGGYNSLSSLAADVQRYAK
jgi:cytochrome c biogenesis protein CcmG, thiol:disulfide interchange protein DsbE